MRVMEVDGHVARCEAKGVERDVNVFLLHDAGVERGDFVLVHVGYAIQKITEGEARTAWELVDEMLAGGSREPA